LLAEKRFGFFALTFGLTMYLAGLALSSPQGTGPMSALAAGVVAAGLIAALLWTRIVGGRVRDQAARAEKNSDGEELPEQ
jgi:membrane protein implicated in regulation of membrane protease activity